MKIYRYMSKNEFDLYSAGKEIIGKEHNGCKTTSVGVCFLPEIVRFVSGEETYEWNPEMCLDFLTGIVSKDEILVEFETDKEMTISKGTYADPIDICDWFATITIKELCTPSYSAKDCKALRYKVNGIWYEYEKEVIR